LSNFLKSNFIEKDIYEKEDIFLFHKLLFSIFPENSEEKLKS
jgi:hypothetical protein